MARWQPARADVIAEYAREVLSVHPRGRIVIGVDGIEHPAEGNAPSDQEAFARDLAAAIAEQGVPAQTERLAGFTRPDGTARAPDGFYDLDRFRAEALTPYRQGRRAFADAAADGWSIDLERSRDRMALVVFGPFLHGGDAAGMWHTSAWLQIPREQARARDAARLGVPEDAQPLADWYAAVDASFRLLDARKRSNATFDLTDPAHPHRRFEDAC